MLLWKMARGCPGRCSVHSYRFSASYSALSRSCLSLFDGKSLSSIMLFTPLHLCQYDGSPSQWIRSKQLRKPVIARLRIPKVVRLVTIAGCAPRNTTCNRNVTAVACFIPQFSTVLQQNDCTVIRLARLALPITRIYAHRRYFLTLRL